MTQDSPKSTCPHNYRVSGLYLIDLKTPLAYNHTTLPSCSLTRYKLPLLGLLIRHGGMAIYTVIISFSLATKEILNLLIKSSCIFCITLGNRFRGVFRHPSFTCFLSVSIASRRALRTLILACSALALYLLRQILAAPLSMGIPIRINSPLFSGMMPRSESMIAFSISRIIFFSHRGDDGLGIRHRHVSYIIERCRIAIIGDSDVVK